MLEIDSLEDIAALRESEDVECRLTVLDVERWVVEVGDA